MDKQINYQEAEKAKIEYSDVHWTERAIEKYNIRDGTYTEFDQQPSYFFP